MKKTITIDISKEFLEKGTLRFSAQTKKVQLFLSQCLVGVYPQLT